MNAEFVELPAFERPRAEYLDDDRFRALQSTLMASPEAGDVIKAPVGCGSCGSAIRRAARENEVGFA